MRVKRLTIGCFSVLLLVLLAPWVILFVASFFNDYVEVEERLEDSAFLADPPAPWEEARALTVVTFNIQDLPVIAKYKHYEQRMRAIAVTLANHDPDVVGFQEAFTSKHRQILIEELRANTRLRYFQYYGSGWAGSGLLTASAYPIVESHFHRYEDSNAWYVIWEGDWWAGKGVSLDRLDLGDGAYLDFYNTHAQAGYGRAANAEVRYGQMRAAADFVNRSRMPGSPAFFVGDVNCRRGAPDYERLVTDANLLRVMVVDSAIDHIFATEDPGYDLEVIGSVEIDDRIRVGDLEFGLSDHNGYLSRVQIRPVHDGVAEDAEEAEEAEESAPDTVPSEEDVP